MSRRSVVIQKPVQPSEFQCHETSCADKTDTLVLSGNHYEAYVCSECGVVSNYALALLEDSYVEYEDREREDTQVQFQRAVLENANTRVFRLEQSSRSKEERDVDRRERNLTSAGRIFDRSLINNDELRACTLDLFRRYQAKKPRCGKLHLVVAACVVEAADRVTVDSSITSAFVAGRLFGRLDRQKAATAVNRARKRVTSLLGLVEVSRWTRIKRFVESLCVQLNTNGHEQVRINAQLVLTNKQIQTDSTLSAKQDRIIACAILVASIGKQPRTQGPTISPASLSKITGISNGSIGGCVKALSAIGVSLSDTA